MKVQEIKTRIFKPNEDLFSFIKENIKTIEEESILVVTSKIISYAEGRFVKKTDFEDKDEKHDLVRKEADFYLSPHSSKYNMMLTIKDNVLAVNAGIDESNTINGDYILLPSDSYKWAERIWEFLRKEYKLKKIGVVVTDSKTMPLRWGITGTCFGCCGLWPLSDYRGHHDIFGRELKMTQINVAEAICVAAVLEMGEADDQKPLAIVNKVSKAEFMDRSLTKKEIKELKINFEDDVYWPILKNVDWKKGVNKE